MPVVEPVPQVSNEKREPADGLVATPEAEKAPQVSPVIVGGGVGSVTPLEAVTAVNGYEAKKACEKTLNPVNKMQTDSNFLIIVY